MSKRKIDLNLLRVLDVLLEENSVSRAAERLEVSQPSISSALARLRTQFEDELFIRRSTGLVPTPYAQRLRGPIREVITLIEGDILHNRNFDPGSAKRTFRLSISDLGEAVILPQLIDVFEKQAPRCQLISSSHPPRALSEAIMRDEVDIAIGYFPDLAGNGVHERHLTAVHLSCLAKSGHPLAGKSIDMATFEATPQAVISHETRTLDVYEAFIKAHGIKRDIKIHMANMASLPPVLAASDLIAIAPIDIARKYPGLETIEVPFELEPIEAKLYWHHRCHNDPANIWLRERIVELFGDKL